VDRPRGGGGVSNKILKNIKAVKYLFPVLIIFLVSSVFAEETVLKKKAGVLVPVENGKERYWYEKSIGPKIAKEIYGYFLNLSPEPVPEIYVVPGLKDHYLVSAIEKPQSDKEFGRCLYLIKRTNHTYELLAHTRGAQDSYILQPSIYCGNGKTIILAEVGAEESWGYEVYELIGKKLVSMGPLDVILDAPNANSDEAAIPSAVKVVGGKWVIDFNSNILLEKSDKLKKTSTYQNLKIKGKKPIVFKYNGTEFILDVRSAEVTKEYSRHW
jgi:hypothetical protein